MIVQGLHNKMVWSSSIKTFLTEKNYYQMFHLTISRFFIQVDIEDTICYRKRVCRKIFNINRYPYMLHISYWSYMYVYVCVCANIMFMYVNIHICICNVYLHINYVYLYYTYLYIYTQTPQADQ